MSTSFIGRGVYDLCIFRYAQLIQRRGTLQNRFVGHRPLRRTSTARSEHFRFFGLSDAKMRAGGEPQKGMMSVLLRRPLRYRAASPHSAHYSTYSILHNASPRASAVGPAFVRSRASSASFTRSGFHKPVPTLIRVPAMIRTML